MSAFESQNYRPPVIIITEMGVTGLFGVAEANTDWNPNSNEFVGILSCSSSWYHTATVQESGHCKPPSILGSRPSDAIRGNAILRLFVQGSDPCHRISGPRKAWGHPPEPLSTV